MSHPIRSLIIVTCCAWLSHSARAQQTLYVSDYNNGNIDYVTSSGTLNTFANIGNNYGPTGIAFDTSGDLFVASWGGQASINGQIQKVTPNGTVTTFATGLNQPEGLAFYGGTLYVADYYAGKILKVSSSGSLSTFAAGLDGPSGITVDPNGNLFVSDYTDNSISKITPSGVVSTLATGLDHPLGLAFDSHGNLFVANRTDNSVSKITSDGSVSTFITGGFFSSPYGLTIDSANNLYVANYLAGTVVEVTPDANVSTFATGLSGPSYLSFSTVPESSSMVILAIGLLGGSFLLRSRRNRQQLVAETNSCI